MPVQIRIMPVCDEGRVIFWRCQLIGGPGPTALALLESSRRTDEDEGKQGRC